MTRHVYIVEEKKDRSGWLVLVGAAVLVAFWQVIFWAIAGFVIYKAGHWLYEKWRENQDARLSRQEALRLRCEYENQLWQEAGIYEGQYAGATMPITQAQFDELIVPTLYIPYSDYNDGLKEWK